MNKLCTSCGTVKPLTDFGTDPARSDGYNRRCRTCHREYCRLAKQRERDRKGPEAVRAEWRSWYATNSDHRIAYQQAHPEYQASQMLRNAVAAGKVDKAQTCSECGSTNNVQAHHGDYSKPLDVVWLCGDCHSLLHAVARRL